MIKMKVFEIESEVFKKAFENLINVKILKDEKSIIIDRGHSLDVQWALVDLAKEVNENLEKSSKLRTEILKAFGKVEGDKVSVDLSSLTEENRIEFEKQMGELMNKEIEFKAPKVKVTTSQLSVQDLFVLEKIIER